MIGEVTLRAGQLAPLSFVTAAVIAGITAYSFARLSSFYPKSAGEAAYTLAAFNSRIFSALTGLAVVLVGSVSAATMVKGFAGYLAAIVPIPEIVAILSITLVIASLSIWGISQSLVVASLITIIEVLGLLFVIYAVSDISKLQDFTLPDADSIYINSTAIFYAAFISFYAYIGFEDIVNIAEETIEPTRVVPLAIGLSLLFSTLLYVILSIACTAFIPAEVFNTSRAPLVAIVEYKGYDPLAMALISIIAILNGALVQIIMASRVLYGMGKQKMFLSIFAVVNKNTRTPIIATVTITGIVLILTTLFNLVTLAEITSTITLLVFMSVQGSLFYLSAKKRMGIKLDIILPAMGILLNLGLLFFGLGR